MSKSEQTVLGVNRRGNNFSCELYIGDQNFTKYLESVRIINSVNSSWPQIAISMSVDSDQVVLEDIYGQKDLFLVIYLSGEEPELQERIDFHLMYLESNVNLFPKKQNSMDEIKFQPVSIMTVPIYSVNVMGTFVNRLYQNSNKTSIEIVEDVVKSIGFTSYSILKSGARNDIHSQFIIPPMSLNQMIDYIHSTVGIFEGPMFKYCDIDGRLKLWDLNKKSQMAPNMIIFQTDEGDGEEAEFRKRLESVIKKSNKGESPINYVTSDNIETLHHSNANILKYSYDRIGISHPPNGLYDIEVDNFINRVSKYGISDQAKPIKYFPGLDLRKSYFLSTNASGMPSMRIHEYNMSRIDPIRITLVRNVHLARVMKVGECIQFDPYTYEYASYQGKYILETSDIQLSRINTDNWGCVCTLDMFRSNSIITV